MRFAPRSLPIAASPTRRPGEFWPSAPMSLAAGVVSRRPHRDRHRRAAFFLCSAGNTPAFFCGSMDQAWPRGDTVAAACGTPNGGGFDGLYHSDHVRAILDGHGHLQSEGHASWPLYRRAWQLQRAFLSGTGGTSYAPQEGVGRSACVFVVSVTSVERQGPFIQ